jgi:hypothetical protein
MGTFLDDLKKGLETGNFNSEAAKKIKDIEVASLDIKPVDAEKSIENRLKNVNVSEVTEEEAALANAKYEETMLKYKKEDEENKEIALVINQVDTLTEIEEMVRLSIDDMFSFVKTLEDNFKEKLYDDAKYADLNKRIQDINVIYRDFKTKVV